jgi:hypothetical protein
MNHKNKNQRAQSTVTGTGGQKKDNLSPQEKHANWTNSKIEKAGQADYNVISQKTRDSAEFVNLINFNDQLMYQLRMNVGINPRVTSEAFNTFMSRSKEAKELINTINAELCRTLDRGYRPPRGFKHPFKRDPQNPSAPAPVAAKKEPQQKKNVTPISRAVAPEQSADQPVSAQAA